MEKDVVGEEGQNLGGGEGGQARSVGFNRGIHEKKPEQHSTGRIRWNILPNSRVIVPEKLKKMVLKQQIDKKL